MNTLQIPDHLTANTENKIQIFEYRINSPNIKNKVALTKNVFSFLQEGQKEIITEKKATKIDNQEFLIISSGNCLMTENTSEKNIYRSILFFFDNSALLDFCNKIGISRIKTHTYQPYTTCIYDDYIRQFVQSLVYIRQNNLQAQEGLLKAKFEEIMYYLFNKNGVDFIYSMLSFQDDDKKDFTQIIESNKLNNLTIQELAFICNMSVSSFKRNFTQHYQASPIKWFQQKRLEYAAHLLNVEKKRPSDIYLEVGFESLSSFIQAFKQKYNATPKQYQTEE